MQDPPGCAWRVFYCSPVNPEMFSGRVDLSPSLQDTLINLLKRIPAMSSNTIHCEDRIRTEPYIQVLPSRTPQPIFMFALAPNLHQIKVPQSVVELPFDKEIKAVCRMFRKHQSRFSPKLWRYGKGFVYHRGPAATLVFDGDCHLQEVSKDPTPRVAGYFKLGSDDEGEKS